MAVSWRLHGTDSNSLWLFGPCSTSGSLVTWEPLTRASGDSRNDMGTDRGGGAGERERERERVGGGGGRETETERERQRQREREQLFSSVHPSNIH